MATGSGWNKVVMDIVFKEMEQSSFNIKKVKNVSVNKYYWRCDGIKLLLQAFVMGQILLVLQLSACGPSCGCTFKWRQCIDRGTRPASIHCSMCR